jgi:hypothetical protein
MAPEPQPVQAGQPLTSHGIQSPISPSNKNASNIEKLEFKPAATQSTLEAGTSPGATYRDENGEEHYTAPPTTAKEIATEVIHAVDDPTLNPWTFRTWFLGT